MGVAHNHIDIARIQRRSLRVVVASQILGGAGLTAGITVGALLAQDLLGTDAVGGLPTALFTLGSALSAFLVGRFTHRLGRRLGLGLGFTAGGLGAIGVVIAATLESIPLLFTALFIYGAGSATNLQARYAGTDLAPPNRRATAVSIAMVSTTLGAVAGPNLITPLGGLARTIGIPELAGPFLLAALAFLGAGTILLTLLKPDPYLIAREHKHHHEPNPTPTQTPNPAPASQSPGTGAYIGATVMVLTQIAMVAIMTMTPIHMRAHGHDMGAVGLVIGLHVGAMYLPSLVTGALVDRIGRTPMAVAAALTLLASGLTAAFTPGHNLTGIITALILLGIGWNFGLIAGTALVVDATTPHNRARTQGSIDVLIALAGAGGGAMSGVVVSASSFAVLSLSGGLLSILLIPVLWWAQHRTAPLHSRDDRTI